MIRMNKNLIENVRYWGMEISERTSETKPRNPNLDSNKEREHHE